VRAILAQQARSVHLNLSAIFGSKNQDFTTEPGRNLQLLKNGAEIQNMHAQSGVFPVTISVLQGLVSPKAFCWIDLT